MSTARLAAVAGRLALLGRMVLTRPYYGFVTGHAHLTEAQMSEVERAKDDPAQAESVMDAFERTFAAVVGDGQARALAGGRMALFTALKAFGVGAGHEVVLPGFTCAVVASAVLRTGATPVFTDVDPATFGTNPEAVERALTPRTRAVIAQHSFGIPCRVDELRTMTSARGIALIEDCALTLGSTLDGVTVGNFGDAAFFSTDHSKPLNTLVGGVLYTRDAGLQEEVDRTVRTLPTLPEEQQRRILGQLRLERRLARPGSYGAYQCAMLLRSLTRRVLKTGMTFLDDDYTVERTGAYPFPARMPAMLARLGLYELDRWPREATRRRALLAAYLDAAHDTPLEELLPESYRDPRRDIVGHRLAYRHPDADRHRARMDARVHTAWTWFTVPVLGATHGLDSLGYAEGRCPVSERTGREVINWPCVVEEGCEAPLLAFFRDMARAEGTKA